MRGKGSSRDALAELLTAAPEERVERVLGTARELLEMEMAYYTELEGDGQTVRAVEGDGGLEAGTTVRLSDSYCQRMLDGRIPHAVGDTRSEPSIAGLPAASDPGLAAYVGVPVVLPDGRVYGTLCCASRRPHPELGDREVRFLRVLARILADDLALTELRTTVAEHEERLRRTHEALALHEEVAEQLAVAKYSLQMGRLEQAARCLDAALHNVQRQSSELLPPELRPGVLRGQAAAGA